jgi:hypothetical protein
VKNGAITHEFTYSDYKDWNNPLNPAEALYAGKMTEKKNGTVTRDIATTLTETAQMYVTMPVPASVKAAIKPTNQPPNWTLTANAPANAPAATQTAAVVTPRTANGKPDLTETGVAPLTQSPVVEPADVVQRRRRSTATSRWTTSGWTMSGSRRRGLAFGGIPSTNLSSGTKFRNSISGRTATIRS